MAEVVIGCGDGVEEVGEAAAGEAGVAEFGVERVVAEQQCDVAGEPLGLVDGAGVAVHEVLAHVVERQVHVAIVVEAELDAMGRRPYDGAALAIEDSEVVSILRGKDRVAEMEAAVVDGGDRWADGTRGP
jgi:hypothetical protein